jgi:hypothetical protein
MPAHPSAANVARDEQVRPAYVYDIIFRAVRAEHPGAVRFNLDVGDVRGMRIHYGYHDARGVPVGYEVEVDEFKHWGDDIRIGVRPPGRYGGIEWFFAPNNAAELHAQLPSILAVVSVAFARPHDAYAEADLDALLTQIHGAERHALLDALFAATDRYGRGVRYGSRGCSGHHPLTRCVKYSARTRGPRDTGRYELERTLCENCAAYHEMERVSIELPLSGHGSVVSGVIRLCHRALILNETADDAINAGSGDTDGEDDDAEEEANAHMAEGSDGSDDEADE